MVLVEDNSNWLWALAISSFRLRCNSSTFNCGFGLPPLKFHDMTLVDMKQKRKC